MTGYSGAPPDPRSEAPASIGAETGAGVADEGRRFEPSADSQPRKLISSLDELPAVAAYLRRVGAVAANFRSAVVRTGGAYPRIVARLEFSPQGQVELVSGDVAMPTADEAQAIAEAFKHAELPTYQPYFHAGRDAPEDAPWARGGNAFVCLDLKGEAILFVQERADLPNGEKVYRPWTYWSDGQWRMMEPSGKLPLFGLEQLRDRTVVCVHEGAKAAQAVRDLVANPKALKGHPWAEDFKYVAHVGWLGGAERPRDTDWAILRAAGVKRVLLVCDNDTVGKNVVRPISRALQLPMDALFFDERWPVGFDLADPLPEALFEQRGGGGKYIGPSFMDCCHPATWATRQMPVEGRGRPAFAARTEFAEEWIYVRSLGEFVHRRKPTTFLNTEKFNVAVRPVSDVKNTADLLHVLSSLKVDGVCYRPEVTTGIVVEDGERLFNVHVPTRVKRRRGSILPFYRFMTQLLPDKGDRLQVMRWAATLIACPQVRMGYGLLLCSPAQGVGKSTFTDHILTPLIGPWNASHPDVHRAVTGGFNSWLAHKRLIVLAEMYVGHLGSKAYDTLKPMMTDKTVTVNEKFRPEYELDNRAHFVGSSNSRVPLFMAGTDRRWFVPTVTETKQPRSYWRRFYTWLAGGGIEVIHQWAFDFIEMHGAVAPEDEAPVSSAKTELVEASLSDGRRLIRDLAEYLKGMGEAEQPVRAIVPIQAVKEWFAHQGHLNQSERKISERVMLEVFEDEGLNVRKGDHRIFVQLGGGRRKMTAVANFRPDAGEEWTALAKDHLWSASKLSETFDVL